ncbi:urease accessory protein UreE [Sulfurospirillum arcachonense]|uniref:urease accessory protein UreE n=1 Tax=Sulfurospirillum arcachonense TaxID=57666 RepID=UPI00046ABD4A|nr:urease accessory protein UreE [Sulfurospirillum arcachonense]
MIKKVIEVQHNVISDDRVELSWYDMQKPNLSAVTQNDKEFIIKIKFTHLHEKDVLVCEDGYKIEVLKDKDEIYEITFEESLMFAKYAYEIGNRHQPICIETQKITILDDISLSDIIVALKTENGVHVKKTRGYFQPNGKAHHSH